MCTPLTNANTQVHVHTPYKCTHTSTRAHCLQMQTHKSTCAHRLQMHTHKYTCTPLTNAHTQVHVHTAYKCTHTSTCAHRLQMHTSTQQGAACRQIKPQRKHKRSTTKWQAKSYRWRFNCLKTFEITYCANKSNMRKIKGVARNERHG